MIERCRHGEEDALGELYKTYAPKLRSVCRRYISNEEMVNDALHDAFIVIFTSLIHYATTARQKHGWYQ